MPNQRDPSKFGARVWVPRELWDNAGQITAAQGTDRSEAITQFLRWLTGEPGAELPEPATRKEPDHA